MTQSKPLAIIAGAGLGLGQSLMQRFETDGFRVVGFSRSQPSSAILNKHNNIEFKAVDLSSQQQTHTAIQALIAEYGAPKVVIHNAAHLVIKPLSKTTSSDFEDSWRSMVLSAFNLAQAVMEPMASNGGGTFIVSGATASLRGGAKFSAFASAKFALRGLTQSLAREHQAVGIHVVHTILDGIIDTANSRSLHNMKPARMMLPEDIAEVYWNLCHQSPSTWTHELDLRPASENF
jgi:NAD(P)-dependent dehydrogenase (short-subunit alcohol dehydrogenase family)